MAYLPISDALPATQNITARDIGSTTVTTNANNQSVTTGSPTAGSVASFALNSYDTTAVQVTGVWSGTLVSQVSFDGGTTWYNQGIHQAGTAYTLGTFTANFSGRTNAAGTTNWRLQSTTAWTGTATVRVVVSVNSSSVYIANNLKLTDGANPTIVGTIKAASTAPVATDPALVVAISPNTTLASGLPTVNGELGDTTGTFTNATQTTSVTVSNLDGYANVFISINGTYGTASAVFEGSDDSGTTWYSISEADRTDSNVIDSGYTSLTNVTRAWQVSIPGFDSIRVRSTAVASGTVNVRLSASASPTTAGTSVSLGNPIPAGTNTIGNIEITNGTNTADVVAGDTGFNGVATASATKTYTFTTSLAGAQTILANTPTEGFNWIEIVYTSVGSGLALTGQWSTASGGTYIAPSSWSSNATSVPTQGLGVVNNTYYGSAVRGNFFQIAVSALASGTFTGTVTLHSIPPPQNVLSISGAVTQSGTWTVGSNSATGSAVPANAFYIGINDTSGNLRGVTANSTTYTSKFAADSNLLGTLGTAFTTAGSVNVLGNVASGASDSGNPVKVGGVYNTSAPTLTNGLRGDAQMDVAANLKVYLATKLDSTNDSITLGGGLMPTGTALNTYSNHITANATNTPTASTAYISSIAVSNEVGGTTSTLTIQDKQGTPLKLVNGLATTALTTAPTIISFNTPVKMVSGIDIITAGAVAATIDVWINYFA